MRLPARLRLIEVGPRDGFQMEAKPIPVELKVEAIEGLAAAGLRHIEAVSFVSPRVIPQMADAAQVLARIERRPGVEYLALVPNLRGAERALAAGADGLRLVVCASETFNQRNVGLAVASSMTTFGRIVRLAESAGVRATLILAVAFGCPFEGEVAVRRVIDLARQAVDLGASAVGLADTAGVANPLQVANLLRKLRRAQPELPVWLHLHDTRGMGLANAMAALGQGADSFDTSCGGLGGCPVMRGASGNLATEDLAYLGQELGLATGVDLDALRAVSLRLAGFLGRELPSRVLAAGTRGELVAAHRDLVAGQP